MCAQGLVRRIRSLLMVLPFMLLACRPSSENRVANMGEQAGPPAITSSSTQDALLLASAKIALPPPGIGPDDLPEPSSSGALLEAQYCVQCHDLPSPGMHSATDWPRVLRRMWLRMDHLPASMAIRGPDEGQRHTLLQYLMANGLIVSGSALPAGPGREEFAMVCSRCHALPDIQNHSPRDWPAVFQRMERNMERTNIAPPSRDQATKILYYLGNAAPPQ